MSKLNEYKTFTKVVETGSISAAAKQLLSSPSSVSKHLSKLEGELGVKLIDRSTQAVSPTSVGMDFYHRVKDILDRVDDAEAMLKGQQTHLRGKLNLAIPSVLLKTGFLRFIKKFTDEYPDIKYDIKVSDQYIDLVNENVDFAFRLGELENSRLTAIQLTKLKLSFYASKEYLKKHKEIDYNNLFDDKHIVVPTMMSSSGVSKLVKLQDRSGEGDVRQFHSTDDGLVLIEMARAGLGVVHALDATVADEVKSGKLVSLLPSQRARAVPLHLVFRNHEYMPEYKTLFKNYIKDNLRDTL